MDDLTLTFDAAAGTAAARGLEAAGTAVDRIASGALPEVSSGTTVDAERGELAEVHKSLNAAADAALAAAAAEKEGDAAWRAWQQTAPPLSAVEEAKQAVAAAGKALSAAAGTDAGAARQRLAAAKSRLAGLIQQRDDAAHTLTEALRRAAERLRTRRGVKAESDPPGTPPAKTPVPDHTGTTPKPNAPAPAAPHVAAPSPGTAPAALAGTASSITPSQASAIAALLAQQQRPAGQPVQIPQQQPAALSPPTAPAASMGSSSRPINGKSAVTADDVDAIAPVPWPCPLLPM
jgi:hypothetical protein